MATRRSTYEVIGILAVVVIYILRQWTLTQQLPTIDAYVDRTHVDARGVATFRGAAAASEAEAFDKEVIYSCLSKPLFTHHRRSSARPRPQGE